MQEPQNKNYKNSKANIDISIITIFLIYKILIKLLQYIYNMLNFQDINK